MPHSQQYFENALRFQPESSTVLTYYAAVLVRTGNRPRHSPYAQRAVRADPDSADAYTMLGYAQFASDHTKDAIVSWKRSLALRPDPSVQRFLIKPSASRRLNPSSCRTKAAISCCTTRASRRRSARRTQFWLRSNPIMTTSVRDLGTPPRDNIQVTLYTETAFFDVTHAPTWVGALNDGKLRIPISGLTSVSPELAHVLKHEAGALVRGQTFGWSLSSLAQRRHRAVP